MDEPILSARVEARDRHISQLRAALEAVEWVGDSDQRIDYCPWCQNAATFGHKPTCQRQQALADARQAEGEEG